VHGAAGEQPEAALRDEGEDAVSALAAASVSSVLPAAASAGAGGICCSSSWRAAGTTHVASTSCQARLHHALHRVVPLGVGAADAAQPADEHQCLGGSAHDGGIVLGGACPPVPRGGQLLLLLVLLVLLLLLVLLVLPVLPSTPRRAAAAAAAT